jgi:two-component sensor histidine kinase
MSASSKPVSARTFLLAFSLALLLPAFGLGGLALYYYATAERARHESDALQTSREAGALLDSEVRSLIATMSGLAASSALLRNDLADFHAQAQRLVHGRNEVIVLRTFAGKQLVNTQVAFGSALPPAVPLRPAELETYNAGQPYVSAVYKSPISGEPRVAVAQKLLAVEAPDYLLAITVPTTRFLAALQPVASSGWIIGVADRMGTYITHSSRHQEVTGAPGHPSYVAQATGGQGTFYAKSAAGVELLAGYYRSELTGWLVAANMSAEQLQAPLRRSLVIALTAALASLGLTGLFAFLFSRRLAGSAVALAVRAEALGQGRTLPPLTSGIKEFGIIDKAVAAAAGVVAERAVLTGKLSEAVQQKELLLKEVNHRVKNSLQLVASLLNLQRNQIPDQQTRGHFEEAARRINTVAQVHQRLYRDDRPDRVALHHFLEELCHDLNRVFPERNITIVCNASECFLSTDRVIPVALILNELIANAFKYSFPGDAGGTIKVSCRPTPDAVELSVTDDGAGLPDGFDPNAQAGLGMKIVSALTRQLRAKLEVTNLPIGKAFTFSIPADESVAGEPARA